MSSCPGSFSSCETSSSYIRTEISVPLQEMVTVDLNNSGVTVQVTSDVAKRLFELNDISDSLLRDKKFTAIACDLASRHQSKAAKAIALRCLSHDKNSFSKVFFEIAKELVESGREEEIESFGEEIKAAVSLWGYSFESVEEEVSAEVYKLMRAYKYKDAKKLIDILFPKF